MRVVSYFLMVLFTVMLIVLIPIGTVLFSLNSTILKPYNTEKYLADSGLYTNLKEIIRKNFTGEDKNEKQSAIQKLQGKLIGQAFDKIVTDDFVASKMALLQTVFWDYMTDKTKTFLHVPIAELSNITAKFPTLEMGGHGDLNTLIGLKADKMEELKRGYKFYSKGLLGLYVLVFILVGICALLSYVLNISGKWLGVSLTIGGVLTLLLSVPYRFITAEMVTSHNAENLVSGAAQLFIQARHDLLQCLTIVAVAVIAVGILSMFMGNREQAPENPRDNSKTIKIL
ncbi:MAG: hypothetical protein WD469_04085 [Paenibacillaceae bacterium]